MGRITQAAGKPGGGASVKPAGRKPKPLNGRGEVRSDAIYPISVLMKRLGIARNSLSSLRKRGLPVHFIGRRCGLVFGWELLNFLRTTATDKEDSQG
jgi:hypothetical protein